MAQMWVVEKDSWTAVSKEKSNSTKKEWIGDYSRNMAYGAVVAGESVG